MDSPSEIVDTMRRGIGTWRASGDVRLRTLADRLAGWLDGGEGSLEAAMGLPSIWRSMEAFERRDAVVRYIVRTYYGDHSARDAATRFARRLDAFREGADWKSHRADKSCPFRPGIRADMWRLLRLVDRSLGAARIRQIVANEIAVPISQPRREPLSEMENETHEDEFPKPFHAAR